MALGLTLSAPSRPSTYVAAHGAASRGQFVLDGKAAPLINANDIAPGQKRSSSSCSRTSRTMQNIETKISLCA
jgi:hypothetical protein